MDNRLYCPSCDEVRDVIIKTEIESYPVKNEPTEIEAQVTYCKHCGEQIWNEALDPENLKIAYRKYRVEHGLLQPEEIKSIREKYALTQTAFAKILGLGEKTIARYETGSLQDLAQNNLIELAMLPEAFAHLLQKARTRISEHEYERALAALQKMKSWKRSKCWIQLRAKQYSHNLTGKLS